MDVASTAPLSWLDGSSVVVASALPLPLPLPLPTADVTAP